MRRNIRCRYRSCEYCRPPRKTSYDRGREHPALAGAEAGGQSHGNIEVVGIALVADRASGRVSPEVVVEITVAEPYVGREGSAVTREVVPADHGPRLEDPIRDIVQRA
jgi:hypothetical protein